MNRKKNADRQTNKIYAAKWPIQAHKIGRASGQAPMSDAEWDAYLSENLKCSVPGELEVSDDLIARTLCTIGSGQTAETIWSKGSGDRKQSTRHKLWRYTKPLATVAAILCLVLLGASGLWGRNGLLKKDSLEKSNLFYESILSNSAGNKHFGSESSTVKSQESADGKTDASGTAAKPEQEKAVSTTIVATQAYSMQATTGSETDMESASASGSVDENETMKTESFLDWLKNLEQTSVSFVVTQTGNGYLIRTLSEEGGYEIRVSKSGEVWVNSLKKDGKIETEDSFCVTDGDRIYEWFSEYLKK